MFVFALPKPHRTVPVLRRFFRPSSSSDSGSVGVSTNATIPSALGGNSIGGATTSAGMSVGSGGALRLHEDDEADMDQELANIMVGGAAGGSADHHHHQQPHLAIASAAAAVANAPQSNLLSQLRLDSLDGPAGQQRVINSLVSVLANVNQSPSTDK